MHEQCPVHSNGQPFRVNLPQRAVEKKTAFKYTGAKKCGLCGVWPLWRGRVGNGDFYNYIMGDTYHFDQGN
jgi:hypothetical protein